MKTKHINKNDRVGSSYDYANNEGFDNYEDRVQDRRDRSYSSQGQERSQKFGSGHADRPVRYQGTGSDRQQGWSSDRASNYGSDRYSQFDQGSRSLGRDYRDDMQTPYSQSSSFGPSSYDQGNTYGQGAGSQGRRSSGGYENQYGAGSTPNRQHSGNDWSPSTSQDYRTGSHSGRGPKNFRRSDERVHEDVCQALSDHADVDASEVEVDVKEGVVTLSGTVESRQIKRMVEESIEGMPGVQDVKNDLRVMTSVTSSQASSLKGKSKSDSQEDSTDEMSSQSNRSAATLAKTASHQKSNSTTGKSVQ